jgi:ubiquinone/menaquinone biosynthesis C-methylase UbiE
MPHETDAVKAANTTFWDGAAARWRQLDLPAPALLQDWVGHLACAPGALLLDAGCGVGRWSVPVASLGYRVSGVDLSPMMIREAQAKARSFDLAPDRIRFQVGDMEHLPFPDARFDGIICLNVLDFVPVPGIALLELRRVLKPGARMLVATLGAYSPIKYEHWRRFLPANTVPAIANQILPWEMEALLQELGWEIIHQQPDFEPSAAGQPNRYDEAWSRQVSDRILQQTVASKWLFVARKPAAPPADHPDPAMESGRRER